MKKRTLLPESQRKNAAPEKNAQYAAVLKKMVDCKTVWTKDGVNKAEYEKFYQVVAESFPILHSKAQRLTFGDGCFFYVLEGENANKNILLMSHHDVVDGGEGWNTDPFTAVEQDGYLYGRGTIDTKTPLFAQLQAAPGAVFGEELTELPEGSCAFGAAVLKAEFTDGSAWEAESDLAWHVL